uniref:Aa_trans domain-containing protein n=1 Tax=Angiostrongylus cantonensis TaxID=6313 RepID=A0A0K0DC15_ANGCA
MNRSASPVPEDPVPLPSYKSGNVREYDRRSRAKVVGTFDYVSTREELPSGDTYFILQVCTIIYLCTGHTLFIYKILMYGAVAVSCDVNFILMPYIHNRL